MKIKWVVIIFCIVVLSACAPSTAPNTRTPPPALPRQKLRRAPLNPSRSVYAGIRSARATKGKKFAYLVTCISVYLGRMATVTLRFGFSESPSTFYISQGAGLLPEMQTGDCISTTGTLQIDDDGTVFIEHGKIAKC